MMSRFRLNTRGRGAAVHVFGLLTCAVCVHPAMKLRRTYTSSYYRYWLYHKDPSYLKSYYSVNGFFASAIGEESCRVSDYKSWGLNTSTGKPRVPVPNAKTRQQLAEKLLVD